MDSVLNWLWQGCVVAVACGVMLRVLERAHANVPPAARPDGRRECVKGGGEGSALSGRQSRNVRTRC